uniref:Uncharacterized protein n=1 Tax=Junco hyemalis TaxID=40217 RepID=A0A8C5JJH1_JUNHY
MLRGARAVAPFLSPVPCPRRRCHRPCPPPRDLAVPNPGWSERMRERHRELLRWARDEGWTRVPSYRRYLPPWAQDKGWTRVPSYRRYLPRE